MKLAFYQPDIPQNTGAAMRLCACMGVELHIIEPTAFPWKEAKFKRSSLDYVKYIDLIKHSSWEKFLQNQKNNRIVLITTKTDTPYTDFQFHADDILLMGSESSGVPKNIHNHVKNSITIPMQPELRSLNVVNAASMVLGEALRQTKKLPKFPAST